MPEFEDQSRIPNPFYLSNVIPLFSIFTFILGFEYHRLGLFGKG